MAGQDVKNEWLLSVPSSREHLYCSFQGSGLHWGRGREWEKAVENCLLRLTLYLYKLIAAVVTCTGKG